MMKALILALMTATPVLAEQQAEVIHADLMPGWQMQNGHQMAALQLSLAPMWKTYWRSPGDAGIPPLFDWSGSVNVKSVQVHWPAPTVFHTNGMQTIGYHDDVILPIEVVAVDATKPVSLRAHVDLGVCKDICMPASVEVSAELTIPGQPDARIRAALRNLPAGAKAAGLRKIACKVEPIADGLRLTAEMDLPPLGGEETVVFESNDPKIWVSEAQDSRQGGVLTASADFVASGGASFGLDRSGVVVTVLGARAMEVTGCPAP